MAVSPTYPGVYIEELPSGAHTITGVATSITAFLGRTRSGPANTGITLTSFGDYEQLFGGLDPDYPVSYAVSDFFAAGGAQAVVVRIFKDAGAAAAAGIARAVEEGGGADAAAVARVATDAAAAIDADASASDSEKAAAAAVARAATDAAGANGATPDTVKEAVATAAAAVTDTSTASWSADGDALALRAAGPGTWGDDLRITIDRDHITDEVGRRYGLQSGAPLFNINVYSDPALVDGDRPRAPPAERIQNVSLFAGAGERRLDRVLAKASNLIVSNVDEFIAAEADAGADGVPIATDRLGTALVFAGGADSDALDDAAYLGSEADKTGLHGLDDVDLINLICVPPDLRGGTTTPAVHSTVLTYAVARRAVLIVDPPAEWNNRVRLLSDPGGLLGDEVNLTGEDARNAFLYYPRVTKADPLLGGAQDTFPACGTIAGLMARTDAERGVWVASAGQDASLGAAMPEVPLTDRENGILNPLAINCIRQRPLAGTVLWGARTLRGADQLGDEYKYLPVRRTALFIEESLYRGTQWVVFKPNDEPLWALIRLNVGAFMHDLFAKGAFQGSKPQDAYFVRCDQNTTSQNDIDRGVVNIVVGFAPLKPAEFVIVALQQITGNLQT
jgi:phage tail sheath protein FI